MATKTRAALVCAGLLLAGSSVAVWRLALEPDAPAGPGATVETAAPEHGPVLRGQAPHGDPSVDDTAHDASKATLRGRVVDESGQPVPGIAVEARTWQAPKNVSDPAARHADGLFAGPKPPAAPTATARSGADGTFVFSGLVGGTTQVRARPGGARVGMSTWVATPAGETTDVELTVARGSRLQGQVVDGVGAGVRAAVGLRLATPRVGEGWAGPWRETFIPTAADGTFSVPAVPSGRLRATVYVAGQSKRAVQVVRTPHEGLLRLLAATDGGAVIHGRVVDSAGSPVMGARVAATTTAGRYGQTTRMTSTDAAGRYRVASMDPGRFSELLVVAAGFAVHRAWPTGREARDGEVLENDVVLFQGSRLLGTVRDALGEPIEGARVLVAYTTRAPRVTYLAVTDEYGAYAFERLPLTAGEIWVLADGHYLPGIDDQPVAPPPAQYGRGLVLPAARNQEERRRDVTLEMGVPVRGRVIDMAGAAVPHARVRARNTRRRVPSNGRSPLGFHELVTQADGAGHFAFAGLAPRPDWQMSATLRGWRTVQEVSVATAGDVRGPVSVEIRMQASASIAGRVLQPDGSPGAHVEVGVAGVARNQTTDRSGAFRFDSLPPGTHDVYLSANYHSRPVGETVQVEVAAGRAVEDIVLRVAPESEFSGVLVDEDGNPRAGVYLSARSAEASRSWDATSAITQMDGVFHFRNLMGGVYQLGTSTADLETRIEGGQHGVRVVMRSSRQRTLHGEVRGPDGKVIPRVTLGVAPGGASPGLRHIHPNVAGAFRLTANVGPGPLSITAWDARDAAGRPLNLRPARAQDMNADEPIVLTMEAGRVLQGRVVDADGQGIPDVSVRLRRHASRDEAHEWVGHGGNAARSDADGAFTFVGLYDGRVTLTVGAVPGWLGGEKVTIEPDQEPVRITLRRATAIGGRVTDAGGRPLVGVRVAVFQHTAQRGRSRTATTAADGSFRIEGITAGGTTTVSAGPATIGGVTYEAARKSDVRPGTLDLVLTLAAGGGIRGIVVGPDGEPVTDAMVEAVDPNSKIAASLPNLVGRLLAASTQLRGGSNAFVLGPLKPREYVLRARPLKGPYSVSKPVRVTSPAGDVRIVLRKGHVLEGRIAGTKGKRFRAFWLRADPEGKGASRYSFANCDAQGRFRLPCLPPVRGRLFVHRDGEDRMAYLDDVDPARGTIEIELRRGLSIEGTVPVRGTPRVTDMRIYARRDGLGWSACSVSADGSFALRGLPPGTYTLSAGRGATKPIEVQAGTSGVALERTK